jgi:hypothetical protein
MPHENPHHEIARTSSAAAASEQKSSGISLPAVKPFQLKVNNTGLPDSLKSGVESLSGFSMDQVKVLYNSEKPAQLQAYAYAQGNNIHLGPGQEKHLAHEAWHIVQQKQGRVQATMQMKEGIPVNDNQELEREADVMGEKASAAGFESMNSGIQQYKEINPDEQPLQAKMNGPVTVTVKKNSAIGLPPVLPPKTPRNYPAPVTEERNTVREILTNPDTRLTRDSIPVIRAHIIPHSWTGPDDLTNVVPWVSDHEEEWEDGQAAALKKFNNLGPNADITLTGVADYSPHLTRNWLSILKNRMSRLTEDGKQKLTRFSSEIYAKRNLIPSSAQLTANGEVLATHQDTSANFKIDTSVESVHDILEVNGYYDLKRKAKNDDDDGEEEIKAPVEDIGDIKAEEPVITTERVDAFIRQRMNILLKLDYYSSLIREYGIKPEIISEYKALFISQRIEKYKKDYKNLGPDKVAEKINESFKAFFDARIKELPPRPATVSTTTTSSSSSSSSSSGSRGATNSNSGSAPVSKGWCFITTACVQTLGLPDDCYELTTLRKFRDTYMSSLSGGPSTIAEYYKIAPAIVESINQREDYKQIYESLFEVIRTCVESIENNRPEDAFEVYKEMVLLLKEEYMELA